MTEKYIKPGREDMVEAMLGSDIITDDLRAEASAQGSTQREPFLCFADAVLDLLPGRSEAEALRPVQLWAERFQPGDRWDPEDMRDLQAALGGIVESHPTSHERRQEAEVKAEALREAADWLADMDDGRDTGQHRAGRDIIARLRDRADRLAAEGGADRG